MGRYIDPITGQPIPETTVANISRDATRPVEMTDNRKARQGLQPTPATQPRPPVDRLSGAAQPRPQPTPSRPRIMQAPPPQPQRITKAVMDEDCGPGPVRPGGVKVR